MLSDFLKMLFNRYYNLLKSKKKILSRNEYKSIVRHCISQVDDHKNEIFNSKKEMTSILNKQTNALHNGFHIYNKFKQNNVKW